MRAVSPQIRCPSYSRYSTGWKWCPGRLPGGRRWAGKSGEGRYSWIMADSRNPRASSRSRGTVKTSCTSISLGASR